MRPWLKRRAMTDDEAQVRLDEVVARVGGGAVRLLHAAQPLGDAALRGRASRRSPPRTPMPSVHAIDRAERGIDEQVIDVVGAQLARGARRRARVRLGIAAPRRSARAASWPRPASRSRAPSRSRRARARSPGACASTASHSMISSASISRAEVNSSSGRSTSSTRHVAEVHRQVRAAVGARAASRRLSTPRLLGVDVVSVSSASASASARSRCFGRFAETRATRFLRASVRVGRARPCETMAAIDCPSCAGRATQ